MAKKNFITYQRFLSLYEAKDFMQLLDDHNILYEIEDGALAVDITFTGKPGPSEVRVKIQQSDFNRVNALTENLAKDLISEYSRDHYLFAFSDEELKEVVGKQDEWSKEDFLLAQSILKERGKVVSPAEIEAMRKERILALRKTETASTLWIVVGFLSAVIGGLPGLLLGLVWWTMKKTDPEGEQYYVYDQKTRNIGKIMFFFSLLVVTILALSQLLPIVWF